MKQQFVNNLMRVELLSEDELRAIEEKRREQEQWQQKNMSYKHDAPVELLQSQNEDRQGESSKNIAQFKRNHPKIGRNEQCFCGSGKKYKNCHGSLSASNEG